VPTMLETLLTPGFFHLLGALGERAAGKARGPLITERSSSGLASPRYASGRNALWEPGCCFAGRCRCRGSYRQSRGRTPWRWGRWAVVESRTPARGLTAMVDPGP
jgi:hypothetical protein